MSEPLVVRLKRELVDLPDLSELQGREVAVVIEQVPPEDMFVVMERLPGEFSENIAAVKVLSESDDPREAMKVLRGFMEGAPRIVERGVVGYTLDDGEVVPVHVEFDPAKLKDGDWDGRCLSMMEMAFLVTRIMRVSGWGGADATRLARFRIRDVDRRDGGAGAAPDGEGLREDAEAAAG